MKAPKKFRFQPLTGHRKNPVLENLRLPLWISPKYDGIRGLMREFFVSRKLKLIPSLAVRKKFENEVLFGCEGELIYGDPVAPNVMQMTTSAVMSEDKPELAKDVKLYVFDWFLDPALSYNARYAMAKGAVRRLNRPDVILIEQTECDSIDAIRQQEELRVVQGFEGIMLRDPHAPYKHGRSTLNEQYLLKLKRFEDAEAIIHGYEQGTTNQNEAIEDELGHSKRSKKAEGMKPNGTLGALLVKDRKNFGGIEIRLGSGPGLTLELRAQLWRDRTKLIGRRVKYRFQRVGVKDAPRFPRFVAFRDRRDG